MRIDSVNKVNQLYQASSTRNISKASMSHAGDKLEISQTGKGYHIAKQVISQMPEIREEKVKEIKQRLQSGTYQINAEEVVDHLIDRFFNEIV